MYIVWSRKEGILFITYNKEKIREYIKNEDDISEVGDDSVLTDFCTYSQGNDERIHVSHLPINNSDDSDDSSEIWVLKYNEDGGGGSYHSQDTWYIGVYDILRDIINDILDCEHNRSDGRPCPDCPACIDNMNAGLDKQSEDQYYCDLSASFHNTISFHIKKYKVDQCYNIDHGIHYTYKTRHKKLGEQY